MESAMRLTTTQSLFLTMCFALTLFADEATLQLEPSRISLGQFPANHALSTELVLTNVSDTQIEGISVRTGCGCLTAIPDADSIPPGGKARIHLSLIPEKTSGPFSHSVFIEAGDCMLRASVTGEAVPLLTVHPQNTANLGTVVCGSPFQTSFLLDAAEPVSFGSFSPTSPETEVAQLSSTSFQVVLRGRIPEEAGRFRFSISIPIASPAGWNPVEFVVFGNAIEDSKPSTSAGPPQE